MSRADRRREARRNGYHRAPSKKGRRSAVRAVPVVPRASALLIARPKVILPTVADIAEVAHAR
jgi:hypothetical protein